MKEATGELSMTAIVVVIIGIIAVAAPPIINSVINSAGRKTTCQTAFNCTESDGVYTCDYLDEDGTLKEDGITCTEEDIYGKK